MGWCKKSSMGKLFNADKAVRTFTKRKENINERYYKKIHGLLEKELKQCLMCMV